MLITEKNLLPQNNNFALFRLLTAIMVFVVHCFDIRGIKSGNWLAELTGNRYHIGSMRLLIFFTMSGFLICHSLVNINSIKQFLKNRVLRLLPAFLVCNLLTVFVLGIVLTNLPVNDFLLHPQTFQFIFRNFTLLSSTLWLPGVFDNEAVNASIWTIPVEVRLYLLLLLIYLFTKLRFRQWLLVLTVAMWLGMAIVPSLFKQIFWKPNIYIAACMAIYFMAGACFYMYKDKIPYKFSIWLGLFVYWLVLFIAFPNNWQYWQHPFFIYTFLYIAVRWPKIPFTKIDISYGVFLYAYPVQKTIQYTIGPNIGFVLYLLISAGFILLFAWLSWKFVEKKARAYRYKPLFRKSSSRLDRAQGPEHETDRQKLSG